jgi:hypothetical protein
MEVKSLTLIIVTSLIPPDKASETLKKYNEIQEKYPLPSYIKQKVSGLRWVREGMKGVAIYEVVKGNMSDALNFVYRYEGEFAGIKGYLNEIETLLGLEEMSGIIPS